jgi:hypothetical protein
LHFSGTDVVLDIVVDVISVAVVKDVIVSVTVDVGSVKVVVFVDDVKVLVSVSVDTVVPSHEPHKTGHKLLTEPKGQKRSRPAHCGVSSLPLQRLAHFSRCDPSGRTHSA